MAPRVGKRFLVLVVLVLLLGGCGQEASLAPVSGGEVTLPAPRQQGRVSLEEALAQRRSIRAYGGRLLTWDEVSQLLWAAQGTTDPRGLRTAPSAGALYPLEVYLILPGGWYQYRSQGHQLQQLGSADLREELWAAGLRQEPLRQAPAIFVITAVVERTARKYGQRAERYAVLEAGHAAQNLLLQATALGLGAVPIGAFDDDRVRAALGLDASFTPLYLIPVGAPPGP
jgi:SagB-type dehydrogenase family enzyme